MDALLMFPNFDEKRRHANDTDDSTGLALDSGFGGLHGDARDLVERRYGDRGLTLTRERYSSRNQDGDVLCTARDGERIVGTLSVRFDGDGGLHADLLFKAELDEWRAEGQKLCEFGGLAMDKHALDPKRVLAQIFHLAYLHAHRRTRCDRLVIEVNPRHVAFYRRWLGWPNRPAISGQPEPSVPAECRQRKMIREPPRQTTSQRGGWR